MANELLPVGTIVNLIDRVDPTTGTVCTIRYVEQDNEFPGLYFYYLSANNDELNTKFDPKIGNFFEMSSNNDEHLIFLSAPTIQ